MSLQKIAVLAAVVVSLAACVSPKTYVDPSFSQASYNDILPVAKKYETKIQVEFQRNSKPFEKANQEVLGHVERTLRATGVIKPSPEQAQISVKVVVNNIVDLGKAAAKGAGTGLTFGAAGSVVSDYYEITIELTDKYGTKISETYQHALHTTIGNKKAPFDNVQATTPADGFGKVMEQTLLNFIKDMQAQGMLTLDVQGLVRFS